MKTALKVTTGIMIAAIMFTSSGCSTADVSGGENSSAAAEISSETETSRFEIPDGFYTGDAHGTVPGYYELYYAYPENYVSMRSEKKKGLFNELGKIYEEEPVFVIDQTTGDYWYCYSPTLDMYGYVESGWLLEAGLVDFVKKYQEAAQTDN